ncbi:hypothetical protein KAR91_28410 [Candidatus Pacearchaeota archaeon]|nr:hypothetical protein [Candidatus Pacearchaeota archaeon]
MTKKNSGKAPSYQMYPKDWNEDTRLKMCSYAAQGLWIRLINTTYDMPEKGVFRFSNRPLTVNEILSLLPGNMRVKKAAFQELLDWKVIKQFDDKSFYCKRLYKDMRLRETRKEAGSKGGNPNLVKHLVNQNSNQTGKQTSTPSSSNSNSNFNFSLELNKLALAFDEKINKLFGPLTKNECVTFSKIRSFLISFSTTKEILLGIDWIAECKQWGSNHDKDNVAVKKCFVNKIKKLGWKPKGD